MKILIVGPSWVGDSVISQSLIKVILSKSKEAKIDVLSPKWTRNIFKRMDEVSETITLPFSHGEMKIKERVDLGKTLKEKNYDQAIVLPNSFKSSLKSAFSIKFLKIGRAVLEPVSNFPKGAGLSIPT